MRRRARYRERKSAVARAVRRARRTINRIQLGPDTVAAMVLVFAGISFVAGLAVGTSSGADRTPADLADGKPRSAAEEPPDRVGAWLESGSDSEHKDRRDDDRVNVSLADFFSTPGAALLDPDDFVAPAQTVPPASKSTLFTRESLGLEEPLLPPQP